MNRRFPAVLLIITAAQFLGGCSVLGAPLSYYSQSIRGHIDVMYRSRPISDWLADEATGEPLRKRLEQVLAMRRFAIEELQLPDNGSYLDYADLERSHVVWNVFSTPEFSLEPLQSCFPFVGCLSYRGYFSQADAENEAQRLRDAGHDVYVGGVAAYSTLGWFADPVLNTMLRWSEPRLASVLFHELGHQKTYADDDSAFNEAFATAVGEIGVERWLNSQGEAGSLPDWQANSERKSDFVELVDSYAQRLRQLYERQADDQAMRAAKADVLEEMRADYRQLRDGKWGGYNGYDGWFASVNNARISAVSTYHRWVPAFMNLLAEKDGDLAAFYAECARAARLGKKERREWLESRLTQSSHAVPPHP